MKNGTKIARILAIIIFLSIFTWSGFQLYSYYEECSELEEAYSGAQDMVQIDTIPIMTDPVETDPQINETWSTETTEPVVEETEPESPYKHLWLNFDIDWDSLNAESQGLVGWLYIPDTNINYPLVKSDDNDYYLNRDYKGKWTSGGSIFLDKRANMQSENVVIYGHHMRADIMFHRLPYYVEQDYAESHKYVYIATETSVKLYEVFSVVRTDMNSDTYTFTFNDEMTKQSYFDAAIANSLVDMELNKIDDNTQLIALSTCSGRIRSERIVVHAALIDEYTISEQATDEDPG